MGNDAGDKWILENYSKWSENRWKKLMNSESPEEIAILITFNHLLVVSEGVAYECLSLSQNEQNVMVSCKDRTLVFYARFQDYGTKFKVLFKSLSDAQECTDKLKKFVVVNSKGNRVVTREETYVEKLRLLVGVNKNKFPVPLAIPRTCPTESAIKLCILEPGFFNLVSKVDKTIENFKGEQKFKKFQ